MPSDNKSDYAVGYGKPPRQTRFRKGQSGNPRGRSPGAKNLKTLLNDALNEPVTGRMHQDLTRLENGLTVGRALDWLRDHPPAGRVIYFYVVDQNGRLEGVVPTRRLLLSPPATPITAMAAFRHSMLPSPTRSRAASM